MKTWHKILWTVCWVTAAVAYTAAKAHDDHGGVNYMDPNDYVDPAPVVEHHHHYYGTAPQPPVVLVDPRAVNYFELGFLLGDLIFGDDD